MTGLTAVHMVTESVRKALKEKSTNSIANSVFRRSVHNNNHQWKIK